MTRMNLQSDTSYTDDFESSIQLFFSTSFDGYDGDDDNNEDSEMTHASYDD